MEEKQTIALSNMKHKYNINNWQKTAVKWATDSEGPTFTAQFKTSV